MVGRRCSDPAPGYFLPPLDYFLYEAELAAPLYGSDPPPPPPPPSPPPYFTTAPPSSSLLNPSLSPRCEQYLRAQGYDFKVVDGRIVLVRARRLARQRRQGQQNSIPLQPGQSLQIIPRQRSADQPITWTGLGFVRAAEGAGLRFTVDNLPASMDYRLVIRYEPQAPTDWLASVSVTTVLPGDNRCSSDPTGSKTLILPGTSRGAVLDSPVCLNAGGRYFVDVILNKQSGPETPSSSYILIDSMGLIPSIESVQDFCSQSDLDSFRRFRCIGLAAELSPQESLPDVCEGLIKSMSARIHNGAVACQCSPVGAVGPFCSKLGGLCECRPHVIGRCCDKCAPLTFGFGPEGCKMCHCDPRGSVSEMCDQVRGQCLCRSEVTGRRCDRCQTGFWGFPTCRPCECNGLSEECDEESGECLHCREHTTGGRCDRCVDGYHGNPVSKQTCEPCLCPDVLSSGRFFATSCQRDPQSGSLTCTCREGHAGPHCSRCGPGFYGNLASPGATCEECPCNNNIDANDRDACDSLTGECRRCLHNTIGPHCHDCKPGYYGNALDQDCRECSCDRRGTEVTQCPLSSPCFCNSKTGQCPCRTGVQGVFCDECDDGYWNLDGPSGCQPCSCDPANALSNICNKVTGQCPCRPEFGGRQCDECGENHFGNPDLQCISCDCNMEGTERPSCDPETGECLCRVGVTGIFCDECAPGYDSAFPTCAECHLCTGLWAQEVADVHRASQTMRTFIPRRSDDLQPAASWHRQQMLEMQSKLDGLSNVTGLSLQDLKNLEKLATKIRKIKDGIDPNIILVNPSPLLTTEIDNIRLEFKKMLNNLKQKTTEDPDNQDENIDELLEEVKKLHREFMSDEKRIRNANKAIEASMDIRQDAKQKLSMYSEEDLTPLKKKVNDLNTVDLNRQVCGGPGLDCSGCGGALCGLDVGNRKCGGPNCDGILPISQRASEMADRAKDRLSVSRLQESRNKVDEAKQATRNTKDQAKDMRDRINNSINFFEKEKNQTKELIQRVKDYLMDELLPPEDIEKMAQAVLEVQLPQSIDQVRSIISEISHLLSNATRPHNNLEKFNIHRKSVQDLLQEANDLKERTKYIDVSKISRDVYEAEKAQDKANDDLEKSSSDRDTTKDRVRHIRDELNNVESKLMDPRHKDLLDHIEILKKKTEDNREAARKAQNTADSALKDTTTTGLDEVSRLFDDLKQKNRNQSLQSEAGKQLKKMVEEAEKMRHHLEDKLQQIEAVDQKIQQLILDKKDRAAQVSVLVEQVEKLREDISQKAAERCS